MPNQNPEQIARDNIDAQLTACGWVVQRKDRINLAANDGVAIREYQTDVGPADYVLFVDKKPVGVIEAKGEDHGFQLTQVEEQSTEYAQAKLKHLNNDPLPFVYESTGEVTRFTDYRDEKPRSRPVFSFHRPEKFRDWLKSNTLRNDLKHLPNLPVDGLRVCQINAITNLEKSFKANRPKALIQMATGSGKTFTAITFIYRLLKYANAKRVLFLVDTRNLGEQAEQEFRAFQPNDDNRLFTELYGVQRLTSGHVPTDNQVYISTIQRLYSVLKGTEMEDSAEEVNPNEFSWQPKAPQPVEYSEKLPLEFFDFVVIDECHRSIYNLWKQVLEYFDAFQIGLTATPDNRTFGYFDKNVVSEYTHEQAVIDGVNVGFNNYLIETEITQQGAKIKMGEFVDKREKLSRKKRWEELDEDLTYTATQLDRDVVNPNQIRTIIRTFKEHLPAMFPDRFDGEAFEVPKTLIFAKTDSHADDIIQIVREEFGESNKFCKKVTYKTTEDPKSLLASFRNEYYPRIAVTVDMIATGTDVKPLEILLFMRDVRSRNYFEQMKGRGTRTIPLDDLKKVTPTAKFAKDHFVIVDAVGVSKSLKTDSRPLERKPNVALKDLLQAVAVGNRDEDTFSTLAGRLIRLDKQISDKQRELFKQKTGGKTVNQVAGELLKSYNPDTVEAIRDTVAAESPELAHEQIEKIVKQRQSAIIESAAEVFTGELNEFVENVRKSLDQIIDTLNPDKVTKVGWNKDETERANAIISDFTSWINEHRDEIIALQIFYGQPFRRRELTYAMIRDLNEILKTERPTIAPLSVWQAYQQLGETDGAPQTELTAIVALIRKVSGIDESLTDYSKTIDRNFQNWVFGKQAGPVKFNEEQMQWLRMIKDHVANSFHISQDDFAYEPFAPAGGLGKMYQLFGEQMEPIIEELNAALAA
ncbi:MAG TPA: type I restriction-modification enzyme R subunit C-terminal domain-containing protein [Pyrinomonadaceae bacterium]|nr:type I restriction-modification enzyme R subunit C-terminal domain-containing protein [Pyrinomonadaceae bacterium]